MMEGKTRRVGVIAAGAAAMMVLLLAPQVLRATGASASAEVITYRLKKGEGLSDVAKKYGVPLGTLIRMNRSRLPRPGDPSYVFTGMAVKVPVRAQAAKPSVTRPSPSAVGPVARPAATPAPKKPAATPAAPAVTPSPPQPKPEAVAPSAAESHPPGTRAQHPEAGRMHEQPDEAEPAPLQQPVAGISGLPAAQGEAPWYRGVLAIVGLAALALVLIVWYYLHSVVQQLRDVRAGEPGPLALIAHRELSRSASIYWIRAGEKDLFISTGPDTQILTAETSSAAAEPSAVACAVPAGAAKAASSRRPRKEPPGPAPD